MDRASLPPIVSHGKDNVALPFDVLRVIGGTVQRDVAPLVAREFGGVDVPKAIVEVSAGYTRDRDRLRAASTGTSALAARLAFFLPRDVVKSAELARQAHARGVFPRGAPLRVLDLGAGLGTTSLGVARYAALAGLADKLEIVAVDEDARALALLTKVFASASDVSARVETVHADLRRHLAKETRTFDLVLAGLALNELPESARVGVCEAMLARAPDGLVMIVEPALAATSRALMAVRDALVAAGSAHVVSPCTHAAPCPMRANARDWCHVDLPIALEDATAALARRASLRDERPTFAGLVLRRAPLEPSRAHRIVSAPLGSKGRTEIHACGGGGLVRLRQLDRHRKTVPVDIATLRRGALVVLDDENEKVAEVAVP